MKRWPSAAAALLLAVGLAWGPGAAEAATGMAVSPSRFRLVKPAGQTASDQVNITNNSSTPLQVQTDVTDMVIRTGEDGLSIRDEAPPGSTPHSCARWIQVVGADNLVIPPGQTVPVEFVVSPPPEVKDGGYGAYLFFIGKPVRPAGEKTKQKAAVELVTVPRLGVSVVYEVEGTIRRKGELQRLEVVPPSSSGPMKIRHQFKNTGNAEIWLTGNFHILDEQGLLAGKGTLKTLKTFPGESGFSETVWQDALAPGRYKLMVTFELGPNADQVIVREVPLEISG